MPDVSLTVFPILLFFRVPWSWCLQNSIFSQVFRTLMQHVCFKEIFQSTPADDGICLKVLFYIPAANVHVSNVQQELTLQEFPGFQSLPPIFITVGQRKKLPRQPARIARLRPSVISIYLVSCLLWFVRFVEDIEKQVQDMKNHNTITCVSCQSTVYVCGKDVYRVSCAYFLLLLPLFEAVACKDPQSPQASLSSAGSA